jgi:hypothetical protein
LGTEQVPIRVYKLLQVKISRPIPVKDGEDRVCRSWIVRLFVAGKQ